MPAPSPALSSDLAQQLGSIGQAVRARRKQLGISATAAAEAAGMSRVTLHRIERGEPSVTMGAYLGALAALGLDLRVMDSQAATPAASVPERVRLRDYPQLRQLAWQLHGVDNVSAREAFELYERHWRHVDAAGMATHERALVRALADHFAGGRLLV